METGLEVPVVETLIQWISVQNKN